MPPALQAPTHESAFASTRWTVVRQAADSQTESQHALSALSELCQIYWRPVYVFLRRQGIVQHDAQDLTQAFFAALIESRAYARADFGVAKAVAEKTNAMSLTHGGFVGPAFASPEQFTNAPVDVRSDIYSLGVTLWFLLTGHMLFSGRTVEDIRDAQRSKPLPIDQLKAARVPHRFISLLTSMLAIEPAARPAGARELARKLEAIRASITGRGKTAGRLALAAAILALATIVAVREFHSTKPTPTAIPEKSVAVLPFQNLSPDPDNAYFADAIQEEILTRLAGIADLKVISRTSTQRYKSKPDNLSEIAKQLGVANILEGSVQKAGDQVRVNVQLLETILLSSRSVWPDQY
jgi:TolB-like protein